MMARRQIERAQVAVLVIDAAQGVTSGDLAIAGTIWELGRAAVVAINKWDLLDDERREELELSWERLDELLADAAAGQRLGPHRPRRREALPGRSTAPSPPTTRELGTGELNRLFEKALARRHPPAVARAPVEALLRDPGLDRAADLHALRQPHPAAQRHLPPLPREPRCARRSTCPACRSGW